MIKFIKYELKHWMKSPMLWIFFGINALLIMGAVSSDNITIGGGVGSVYKNAPTVVQSYYGVMSIICLMMTVAFMNATASRDFSTGMHQFIFSSPISKRDYFFGKYFGAFLAALIPMLGISFGALIGPFMPWASPERFGGVVWSGHISGFFAIALPNIFITGVLLYGLAVIFRSNIISFVGGMAFLVLYLVTTSLVGDIEKEWISGLVDPFGIRPMNLVRKYSTVAEKNAHAAPFIGWFLYNRIIWIGLALIGLILLYKKFSFSEPNRKIKKVKTEKPDIPYTGSFSFTHNMIKDGGWSTLWNLIKFETKAVVKNNTFIILLLIGVINLGASLSSFSGRYGAVQYPVTYDIIDIIRAAFYMFLLGFIVFYTGFVVWKEKEAKLNEIQDTTPVKSAYLFISKFVAINIGIFLVLCSTILVGVIAQTFHKYTRYELGVYAQSLLIWDFLSFVTLTGLALFFHYLINNKYIAYFVFLVFVALNAFGWGALKISTHLVQYGSTPSMTYSDMNKYGPFLTSNIWFNLYWLLGCFLVCYLTYLFFLRGREESWSSRWNQAKTTFGVSKLYFGLGVMAFFATGANIYYNTLVKNKVISEDDLEQGQIYYEKNYKKYQNIAQPEYISWNYDINIFPEERNLIVKAECKMVNLSNEVINDLHFTTPTIDDSLVITIPGAKTKLRDNKHGYRIYTLAQPMKPGDTITMKVDNIHITKGFENEVSFTQITANGTFFNNMDIIPEFGYNPAGEISDKNKRVKFGLPVKEKMPRLDERNLKARSKNYLGKNWVDVTTKITTKSDQIAVAPGSLINTTEANGRKTYIYKLDKKSLDFYSFISAKYEVARKKWNGIDLEVYYHKDHAYNVPNMLKSMEKSLEYYTKNFGPYYHKQCRIIEFPRYAGFAQAFPGTMPYSESIGFITDLRDVTKDDIDVVYYVVAHEMGHQYWAHQVVGADMQGSEMMSEGFAQYSALMVMEKEYGKDKMKKFLKYETDGYLAGRGGEFEAERSLMKTEGQGYIHYQKASAILYYFKEMVGEEKVNSAMKSLIDSFGYKAAPYPTSYAAVNAFKKITPDSLQYLIADLFENITIFSNRVKDVSVKQVGKEYEVTFTTISEKFYSDSLGKEMVMPLRDYIDIGVFTKGKDELKIGKPLFYERRKITNKDNTFTIRVKEKPYQVGIDPYNYLIDRIGEDNVKKV